MIGPRRLHPVLDLGPGPYVGAVATGQIFIEERRQIAHTNTVHGLSMKYQQIILKEDLARL
jgi:hypothetical protein